MKSESMTRSGNAPEIAATPSFGGKTIVLVGLMGAGKSSVGRRLATYLDLPFKDADTEIETASNLTVPEFFEIHGEDAFRDGERKVIARLLDSPQHVLATGGGAYMDPQTRAVIHSLGCAVWLRADLETLLKRCLKRNTRPLLNTGDPREILEGLIAQRYPIYEEADIVVDSNDGPHEHVVERIVNALREKNKRDTHPLG